MSRKKTKGDVTLAEHARSISSAGGRARMDSMSEQERKEFAQSGGLAGGEARAKALTKKRRSEIAREAAKARWSKVNL